MGVGIAVPGILEIVERGKTNADLLRANGIGNGGQDFENETAPVLESATVLISAVVDVVVEELLQKITVCS